MSFAVEVTSAAGGIATFTTPDGVTHQTSIPAEADGHVVGSRPDYWAYFTAGTNAQNREVGELFNASASNIVRVRGVWILPTQTSIATGVQVQIDLNRISSVGNGATTITPRPTDTTFPAMPSGVTARTGSTTGAALVYAYVPNFQWVDELSPGLGFLPFVNLLPVLGDRCVELVLRPSQGLQLKQITNTTTGVTGGLMYFVVDN